MNKTLSTAPASAIAAAPPPPLDGLYGFVRAHLLIANNIVLASVTLVGVLDFLAPRLSVAPLIVYSATAGLLTLMVVAGFAPASVGRLMSGLGVRMEGSGVPLRRRPAWQFAVAILLGVSVVGFASVSKASQGGLIASSFPSARAAQESMLGLRQDVADIKSGVDRANAKLDQVASVVDPDLAADRCADLECALQGGASAKAVRRLFERGARVPGDKVSRGELLREAALMTGPDRFEIIDMLAQRGIDRDEPFLPRIDSEASLTRAGQRVARQVLDASRLGEGGIHKYGGNALSTGSPAVDAWNDAIGCVWRTNGGLRLIDMAALLGDADLYAYLAAKGSRLGGKPLACGWGGPRKGGSARIEIDPASGKVLRVAAG